MYPFRQFITNALSEDPHYMVIGHPISHSLSPLMHNTALEYNSITAKYYAIDIQPDDFSSFVSWINRSSFLGCNVTIPYKQLMMDVADELDDSVQSVGALNTILKEDGRIIGFNTDIAGYLYPLEQFNSHLEGSRVIIFGTGGASRAVIHALGQVGVEHLVIVSRNPLDREDFHAIADHQLQIEFCGYNNWQAFSDEASMIVNTTPLGMLPNINGSPVSDSDLNCLEGKICYDLVYNPLNTKFLQQAVAADGIPVEGLQMLLHQGNESFRLWTGKTFPLDEVETLLRNTLSSHKGFQ